MPVISYRCDDARKEAIDAARGDISIQRWFDRLVDVALDDGGVTVARATVQVATPSTERTRVVPSRVPAADPLAARQAALNKGKGM